MDLIIKYQAPDKLVPNPQNALTHDKKQIDQIAASIRQFGFTNSILVDKNNIIVAGQGRLLAAIELGLNKVPTVRLEDLSEDDVRAYMLADNKLARLAKWDNELLAIELQHLYEIGFNLEITGFETPEIDIIIGDQELGDETPLTEDEILEPNTEAPAIVQLGQLWQLGDHLLYCGDSLNPDSYKTLMGRAKAQMVFTDPPYNVPINGHVSGKGGIQHREFDMAIGEMSQDQFIDFLTTSLENIATYSVDGAIVDVCMDWRHVSELEAARIATNYELKNICVWVKDNGGMGSLYRSRHEMIFILKNGKGPHINNIELGKHGRNRTNVWEYPGVNSFGGGRMEELTMHPTVKPVSMVADAIMDCSKRNAIILDPFGGSGTTLIAAENTARKARIIELDPHYCDVTIRRWETLTGKTAKLKGDNNE
jgi:DNA modification methylase